MEKTRGRILILDSEHARATVQVDTAVFCSRCATGKGCGAGIFGSDSGPRQFEAPILGPVDLKEGDEVQIELAPQSVLHAALIVYGVPLASALVVSGLAWLGGLTDGAAVVAVVAGIGLSVLISRRRLQRSNCLRQFTPAITRRLAGAE